MPYGSVADLPQSVKERLGPKKRRQWLSVWNSSFARHKDESRAFAEANSVVNKAADLSGEEAFNFFMPIVKVDKERRTVSGYASTDALDFDGERVSKAAIKDALPGYWGNIREMHKPWAVGTAKEANIDAKGLYVVAKIVDNEAWKKVDEGVYKGFSVGGKKLAKDGNVITKLDLVEISIVDRPANPECRFTVQKSAKTPEGETPDAYLLPVEENSDASREALRKMAEVVEFLASESPNSVEKKAKSDSGETKRLKKEAKAAKKAAKLAKAAETETAHEPSNESASSSFLTLDAAGGAEAALGRIESSHELDLEVGQTNLREGRLSKRMSAAGDLSYSFDQLRRVQRSLISEAKTEGGDRRDLELARRVGETAKTLAEIISDKALHEGEEAMSLTDADDVNFLSIYGEGSLEMADTTNKTADPLSKFVLDLIGDTVRKATAAGQAAGPSPAEMLKAAGATLKAARKDLDETKKYVEGLFNAHKTAFQTQQKLIKAGKDKDEDKFDHESAMKMLKSVYESVGRQMEVCKAARATLKKAAGRIGGEGVVEDGVGGVYKVPDGITTISPGEMDNLRAAKAGFVSKTEAEALVKAAVAEAQVAMLSKLPAGPANGQRPFAFDMTKFGGGTVDPEPNSVAEFFKNADSGKLLSTDEKTREAEISKVIGERILNGSGNSLFDPNFRGTGGIGGIEPATSH